jgi:hypothetical protein
MNSVGLVRYAGGVGGQPSVFYDEALGNLTGSY